ncbi:hypothetical protein ACFPL7_22365 [Dongia soli]|uniref:Uncharacterized protein n=1 Tax=Dongia soli TaxID=600628 RepID=A0ABU5E8Z9_9PROT|nr:hypothetical protein [Dongia soli]MDY0882336.1 hypothetical protein [Dongia soli]
MEADFEDFARMEIRRRGDRALAYARARRDRPIPGLDPVREQTFWGKLVAAIEQIEANEPSPAVPNCLLCGHVAEYTDMQPGKNVEQFCADCGPFQVTPALFAKWQADPKKHRRTYATEMFLEACADRGDLAVFDDLTLARIERQYSL